MLKRIAVTVPGVRWVFGQLDQQKLLLGFQTESAEESFKEQQ